MISSSRHISFEDRRAGVRKVREACGWTQQDLAFAAKISQAKISQFETGGQDLSEAAFLRLEQALLAAMAAHRAELEELKEVEFAQRVSA
jgi:transcriptional regulator with XRE-family HTH domain